MGTEPRRLRDLEGRRGAAAQPVTALLPCAPYPRRLPGLGLRLHLPPRGLAPSPRWAPLGRWAAGGWEVDCPQGRLPWGRAAGRGGTALWGGGR